MKRWQFLRGSVDSTSDLRKPMEASNWVMTVNKRSVGLPHPFSTHLFMPCVLLFSAVETARPQGKDPLLLPDDAQDILEVKVGC